MLEFHYNIPEEATCKCPKLPDHGRLICGDNYVSGLIICMAECEKDYERKDMDGVYNCHKDGKWRKSDNIEVDSPEINCTSQKLI